MAKKRILAYFGLSLATLIVGFSLIFLKIGLKYTNAIDLLMYRFSFAFITLLILSVLKLIKIPKFRFKTHKILLLLSLFYPFLFFLLQAVGMQYSSASEAGVVFAIAPIITLIAAQVFLKERHSSLQKLGIILSVAGVVYIVYSKKNFLVGNADIRGIILLLSAIFSMVSYYVIGKKIGTKFSALEITVWIIFVAFVTFGAISLSNHLYNNTLAQLYEPLLHSEFIWSALYLGILSSVLTAFLMNYSLPLIPAAQISVFGNFSPIISIISGVLFLHETLHSYLIVGGSMVLIGIIITLVFKGKKSNLGK